MPDAAVPMLLRALRDEAWFIQRNASFVLNRTIGKGAPEVIDYAMSTEEIEAAIDAYHAWWDKKVKAKEAREQG